MVNRGLEIISDADDEFTKCAVRDREEDEDTSTIWRRGASLLATLIGAPPTHGNAAP